MPEGMTPIGEHEMKIYEDEATEEAEMRKRFEQSDEHDGHNVHEDEQHLDKAA